MKSLITLLFLFSMSVSHANVYNITCETSDFRISSWYSYTETATYHLSFGPRDYAPREAFRDSAEAGIIVRGETLRFQGKTVSGLDFILEIKPGAHPIFDPHWGALSLTGKGVDHSLTLPCVVK